MAMDFGGCCCSHSRVNPANSGRYGRDGSCIGIEFLGEVLERGVVGCADDRGQLGFAET